MIKKIVLNGRTIEYTFVQKKVKNINLRIKPDGSLYVSANPFVAQRRIDDFLISHAERILCTLDKFKSIAEKPPKEESFEDGGHIWLLGEEKPLQVAPGRKNKAELVGGTVSLTAKSTSDTALIRKTVEAWRKELCEQIIKEICNSIYPIFEKKGVPFPEIRLRKMKSRWGSCQPKNAVLTFNTRLIHCPPECIEYVIVHEFAHFLRADHSKAFYGIVASVIPDWKERREKLKEYTF